MHESLASRGRPVHMPSMTRHNHPVIIHLTVCTQDRRPVLANNTMHECLIKAYGNARSYRVGQYVIMPDHIHLFCSPAVPDAENVSRWVAYWKRLVSIQMPELCPLWQRDCWDTQMREPQQYHDKWNYIRANPVRRELAKSANEWPFQGELNKLLW